MTATVNWCVKDPELAARMAADTMIGSHATGSHAPSTPKLEQDVMKQAMASLAAAIGSVRYSDKVHVAASEAVDGQASHSQGSGSHSQASGGDGLSEIFSAKQMSAASRHANDVCSQYGVTIVSINVSLQHLWTESWTLHLALALWLPPLHCSQS